MDIFSLAILFFVISTVFRMIKKVSTNTKNAQTQTQEQVEATKPKSVPNPPQKREDFRFPSMKKSPPQPVFQEGGDPKSVMSKYTPIAPSSEMKSQFSNYKGSLNSTVSEGIGYQTEAYSNVSAAYQSDTRIDAKILPKTFNRNALIQAVVMSEILKRPGESRR